MRWTSIASSLLLACSLAACGGGTRLDPQVAKGVSVARASKDPAYWLGPSYRGLKIVHVEAGPDAFFASSLWYADCSWLDLNSLSPRCRQVVEVDNSAPAPGEISTMGRCTFSTTIDGVTVATFPVNPHSLRVFARGATVMVSSESRALSLRAIAALRPLNGHALEQRDVSAVLGTCKAPPPGPPVHLTARQRYEQRMKRSFFVETTGPINLRAVDPLAAKPRAILDEFMTDTANVPPLLRNEANGIAQIQAPHDVAQLQAQLVTELRAYADVLDAVRAHARADGLDEARWAADRAQLQPRIDAATAALVRTVHAFADRGYSIYVPPSD